MRERVQTTAGVVLTILVPIIIEHFLGIDAAIAVAVFFAALWILNWEPVNNKLKHWSSPIEKTLVKRPMLTATAIIAGFMIFAGLLTAAAVAYSFHRTRREIAATTKETPQEVLPAVGDSEKPEPRPPESRPPTAAEIATELASRMKPAKPLAVRVHFKNSPLFTDTRKQKISQDISQFYEYLVALGFEIPKEAPPFRVGQGQLRISMVGDVLDNYIELEDSKINDRSHLLRRYAHWAFLKLLPADSQDPERKFNGALAYIYSDYYSSSFSGIFAKVTRSNHPYSEWANALRELRVRFGQEFADKLLYYAYARRKVPLHNDTTLDIFLGHKIYVGLDTFADKEQMEQAAAIIEANGIKRPERPRPR